MCRSSAQGGRRCSGSNPVRSAAAQSGSSRNWDGSPETAAETRFHDLRDSGYTGPIDQDGHKIAEGAEADRLLADRDRL